ncbi:unnamed protein product [Prunus armeniaca]
MVASRGGCSGRGYGDYSRVASCGGRVFGDHGSFSPSCSEFFLGRSFSGTPNRSTSAASWQYFWAWSYWATAIWLYSFSFGPPSTRGPIQCFNCHGFGHIATVCPSKASSVPLLNILRIVAINNGLLIPVLTLILPTT